MVSRNPSPYLFAILSSKRILVECFLRIRVSPYDVTRKNLFIACVPINIFVCGPGITSVIDNFTRCIFLSRLCYPFQLPCFIPVRVIMSPTVNRVLASLRFVMFSSEYPICDVSMESLIKFSLLCSWLDFFEIHSLLYIVSSVMLFADSFSAIFFLYQFLNSPFLFALISTGLSRWKSV